MQEDGEGIAVCTVSHKATGKPLYCLITYVYPTLSARAVPQLKEFCETHRRLCALVRVGPHLGDWMPTNACAVAALACCWMDSGQPSVSALGPGVLDLWAGGEGHHVASNATGPRLWTTAHESSKSIREDVNPSALLDPACVRDQPGGGRVVHNQRRSSCASKHLRACPCRLELGGTRRDAPVCCCPWSVSATRPLLVRFSSARYALPPPPPI